MKKIAVLGYGVVGTGLIEIVEKNKTNKTLVDAEVVGILVKNRKKHEHKKLYDVVTDNPDEIFDREWSILIEVIGGVYPAYEYIKRALNDGKHVITANKDLIAEYGDELFALAASKGVSLKFEASVAGGIPVIKPLLESLEGNSIESIKAILNGTTNFILTKMYEEGLDYEEALQLAQNLGFAESNPESDVEGYDAARKLSILSTIAYKKRLWWKDIYIEGITGLDALDFKYAREANCKIKLIAYSKRENGSVYASVKPVLVDSNSEFSLINNEINSVKVYGDAVGELTFTGKGAGMLPTASAVYSDLIDVLNDRHQFVDSFSKENLKTTRISSEVCEGIIRVKTSDKDESVKMLNGYFDIKEVISLDEIEDEVAVIVREDSEDNINLKLQDFRRFSFVHDIKKIIKFY